VFPNPARKEINIVISDQRSVSSQQLTTDRKEFIARIKNSIGQEIFQKQFSTQLKIDASQFSKGLFLIEVCTSEGNICHMKILIVE